MGYNKMLNMLRQAHLCFSAVEVHGAANIANMYNGFVLLERAIKEAENREDGKEVKSDG